MAEADGVQQNLHQRILFCQSLFFFLSLYRKQAETEAFPSNFSLERCTRACRLKGRLHLRLHL